MNIEHCANKTNGNGVEGEVGNPATEIAGTTAVEDASEEGSDVDGGCYIGDKAGYDDKQGETYAIPFACAHENGSKKEENYAA